MRAVAVACVRRALVFPYLRRWDLACLCLGDTATVLMAGKRAALRCLLAVRRQLCRHGGDEASMHYLLNTLWLDDYCVWLQAAPEPLLAQAGAALSAVLQPAAWGASGSASSVATPSLPLLHKSLPAFARWRLPQLEESLACGDSESDSESDSECSSSCSDSSGSCADNDGGALVGPQ